MVSFVVAVAENGVIGQKGELPWGSLPDDLQHFKRLTLGHPVIMGRRTYDSLGRALPKRPNLVVTRQPGWAAPNCETLASVPAALARARELDPDVFGEELLDGVYTECDRIAAVVLEVTRPAAG